ncbi:methyltransferase domain-containing protein [Staphylococcus americanisciuri]|uniref:Class I SAM-dependent methyltransferase n=1 Tax=Staphylococcus americanisciuri TaxID=2973940 RepID=A0ABT2F2P3_9STAP|nr:class I SAM-dependent methyltransferase [Staphylococcus americanisciuri]MCS4486730.1 class I SAM-dependent methyltransferase [Staphylococcus americanisciuri]
MGNIDLEIYEKHMQSDNVFQLQTLNLITKEQVNAYNNKTIGILGVAGGNGLEHIELANINKVYGFDINKNYLDICQRRFSYMQDKLSLIQKDFTQKDFVLSATDLLIANMIIEYIGILKFTELINKNKTNISL